MQRFNHPKRLGEPQIHPDQSAALARRMERTGLPRRFAPRNDDGRGFRNDEGGGFRNDESFRWTPLPCLRGGRRPGEEDSTIRRAAALGGRTHAWVDEPLSLDIRLLGEASRDAHGHGAFCSWRYCLAAAGLLERVLNGIANADVPHSP
jgi:hypothetical protein